MSYSISLNKHKMTPPYLSLCYSPLSTQFSSETVKQVSGMSLLDPTGSLLRVTRKTSRDVTRLAMPFFGLAGAPHPNGFWFKGGVPPVGGQLRSSFVLLFPPFTLHNPTSPPLPHRGPVTTGFELIRAHPSSPFGVLACFFCWSSAHPPPAFFFSNILLVDPLHLSQALLATFLFVSFFFSFFSPLHWTETILALTFLFLFPQTIGPLPSTTQPGSSPFLSIRTHLSDQTPLQTNTPLARPFSPALNANFLDAKDQPSPRFDHTSFCPLLPKFERPPFLHLSTATRPCQAGVTMSL